MEFVFRADMQEFGKAIASINASRHGVCTIHLLRFACFRGRAHWKVKEFVRNSHLQIRMEEQCKK